MYGVEAPNVWLLVKAIQELKAENRSCTAAPGMSRMRRMDFGTGGKDRVIST
jgi:hypothetical protein